MNKITSKAFLRTLFVTQNRWHKHSVLGHVFKVIFYTLRYRPRLFLVALLHDIGKPFVAHKDSDDLQRDYESWSFTNHEELSYMIIKNWFIPERTKILIRYHYLIRGMQKALIKDPPKFRRLRRIWEKLPEDIKDDLYTFKALDDKGK